MNKKIGKRILWILSILSYIGLCISYFYLPDKIPIHWNSSWEIDGWTEKQYIFLLGLLPIGMLLLLEVLPIIDPRRDNYKKSDRSYYILQLAVVLLLIVMDWITVIGGFESHYVKLEFFMPVVIGVAFIIIGNYLPTIKSNYFVGIKNPWALSNETVWRKTHKVGGYIFILSGILMIIMSFIRVKTADYIMVGIILTGFIGVNIYSYFVYKKLQ